MPRTRPPNKRILKRLLHRPMNMITHILNRAPTPHNQRLVEIRIDPLPLRVQANEIQHLPAAVDDVLDAEVEFAGHDGCVGFAGEHVEVLEGDGVDFVVDVEAFDVFAVVFHDYVDEVIDGDLMSG